MYVPEHLKWRVLIARTLKESFFEAENAARNCRRIFDCYARYLLGTTYDTFLCYLKESRYAVADRKLPIYIVTTLALLEDMRTVCERLRQRKPDACWSLIDLVEELLRVLREHEQRNRKPRFRME